jgi:hypothetical protein
LELIDMKRFALVAVLAALVTGCGAAPTATRMAPTGYAAAATNAWLGLKDVTVKDGGPSDWYTTTKRHIDAKTAKNGRLWVMDNPKGSAGGSHVEVAHNSQTITSAKKLAQIAEGLEEAAAKADAKNAATIREFAAMIRASLK